MPLKKSVGNMYPWVTHTHCHLGGECPHKCVYCYVKSFPFRPPKYQGELRLIEKELTVNYGEGKTIFIENCNDMFANEVPHSMICRILEHCIEWPDNTYVFQTKNPVRYHEYRNLDAFPEKVMLGTTIETNRAIEGSAAPLTFNRAFAMSAISYPKFITVEPILDFDVDILASWIFNVNPKFVNIGADSKGHNLPEPPVEKVYALIDKLKGYGIEIREKHNLNRLKN